MTSATSMGVGRLFSRSCLQLCSVMAGSMATAPEPSAWEEVSMLEGILARARRTGKTEPRESEYRTWHMSSTAAMSEERRYAEMRHNTTG
jgi:hypothetical protein